MGFLGLGDPFEWTESREEERIKYVREHGIEQFLNMWDRVKGIDNDTLKWGDEIEYGIFALDAANGTVKCSLRGAEILAELQRREKMEMSEAEGEDGTGVRGCQWVPEYGAWMVEATPDRPYSAYASDLVAVERNMRLRRARLLSVLRPDEICPTVPCFPLLGVGTFTEPAAQPKGPIANSLFIPDAVINPHPRFGALTRNIRTRRGQNVDIRMPKFLDEKTPSPERPVGCAPPSTPSEADGMAEVYMDAMAFGMGCCCLQVTFQAREVQESRHLYDQLAVLTPMLLALTAATPYARGTLLDSDSRWDIISQSVDDRTPAERRGPDMVSSSSRSFKAVDENAPSSAGGGGGRGGRPEDIAESPAPAGGPANRPFPMAPSDAEQPASEKHIYHEAMAAGGTGSQHKSRYDSISLYICQELAKKHTSCSAALNDVPAPYDREAYERLLEHGIDKMLARHVAHLFSRDPLVIFSGRVNEIDDKESTEHFENLQSTNWQTVRWKPPPASSRRLGGDADIGWRVEFRSMEVQLTDFENAAFTVFIVLLSRVILYFDLNLYQPLSKVDENMSRAQKRNALLTEKFWFAQSLMPVGQDCPGHHAAHDKESGVGKAASTTTAPAAGAAGYVPSRSSSFGSRKMQREKVTGLFGAAMDMQEVTILEILQGKGSYKGLIPMILAYLDAIGTDSITLRTVSTYLDFIVARAAGELMTPAAWMRSYIRSHPDYKYDSVVSERIAADLMAKCHRIGQGIEKVPELHGNFHIEPVLAKDGVSAVLASNMPLERSASGMTRVVERYAQRAELMARKRALQVELENQKSQVQRTQQSLSAVESELAAFNPSPFAARSGGGPGGSGGQFL